MENGQPDGRKIKRAEFPVGVAADKFDALSSISEVLGSEIVSGPWARTGGGPDSPPSGTSRSRNVRR